MISKTILVVDDSVIYRQMIGAALRGAGYEVVEAVDGKDALAKLDGSKLHLIISDLNMPEIDGLEFVARVKQMDSHKFVPVLMLTTETSTEMKARGRGAGVRAWISKPFHPPQLLDAVSKLVLPL